ncbi:GumC family protein [Dyadobacter luticola]|uniref:Lipopolysaccharide biosynthesis protein n=1 Tax=Dyadobacter luticola TaxID=1979387 RepID=A0A5R9L2L2_9BACT|nr:Wzz/FepE/Etk N-terminal domain-containing protein [Dyadobacter luticola]TLV02589.1 lipopolysaccharide biosynthesis protein [Dyadobacter luticola]
MTELSQFLRILYRNKLILIFVPLITVVAAYFLVKALPDQYKSNGSIATGLVDKTEQGLMSSGTEQDFEIARKFDNIIQMMTQKKVLDQVSYQLLMHDLKSDEKSDFAKPSKLLTEMSQQERQQLMNVVSQKYKAQQELLPDKPFEKKIQNILADMEFDAGNLQKKLTIYRASNSDYVNIDFEGKNAYLTAFVINTLSSEFINMYSSRLATNYDRTINFLADFLEQKRQALRQQMNGLRDFKIKNRVLNLDEQAKSLYGQISEFELRREVAKKDIIAYGVAIRNIDNRFSSNDRKYFESAVSTINQNIVATKQMIRSANEAYVKSNFDPKYKAKLDSAQTLLSRQITESTDRYLYSPLTVKQNLVSEKLTMEIARDLAVNSVATIEAELKRLNSKFDGLVPNEAKVQEFETAIDIAGREYMEALQKYNDARLQSSFPAKLKVAEKALPGTIQPSKKIVLIILSGVISLAFCLFVLFILYFFDNSIRFPQQLANATDRPVLGFVNHVSGGFNLTQLQNETSHERKVEMFRNLIRSIRFELDNEYPDPKIISVTSLAEGSGKTLLTISLAWAYSKINKRVLIIDGNFTDSDITKLNTGAKYLEDFLSIGNGVSLDNQHGAISILGNKGGDVSLYELSNEAQIRDALSRLKSMFDVILIEADSLVAMNKAKEWVTFSDTVVAVFESGHTISYADRSKIEYLKGLNGKMAGWVLTGANEILKQTGKVSKYVTE